MQLLVHVSIDVIQHGKCGPLVIHFGWNDDGLHPFGKGVESAHQKCLTAFGGGNQPGIWDDFYRVIIAGGKCC